jgi:hypothetical protein
MEYSRLTILIQKHYTDLLTVFVDRKILSALWPEF